ncbi:hypothetical protein E2C01_049500 [Portunus trituberculatus]|uniref:Uncharacterized protein n=1 Tax=Portunus trituberculatus TaxID=210409 RepID=A0A5B7GEJ7_PORTR|nr:hypothetical protein [Portunus trituberculatus]
MKKAGVCHMPLPDVSRRQALGRAASTQPRRMTPHEGGLSTKVCTKCGCDERRRPRCGVTQVSRDARRHSTGLESQLVRNPVSAVLDEYSLMHAHPLIGMAALQDSSLWDEIDTSNNVTPVEIPDDKPNGLPQQSWGSASLSEVVVRVRHNTHKMLTLPFRPHDPSIWAPGISLRCLACGRCGVTIHVVNSRRRGVAKDAGVERRPAEHPRCRLGVPSSSQ